MAKYQFGCGCEFEIIGPPPVPGGLPQLHIDPYLISPNCQKTWEILGRGETKGVFQLESPLGRKWCKTLKPEDLEHMSALGALLRPGCLRAEAERKVLDNGTVIKTSMTELYCLRKNGEREIESFHPVIDEILKPTFGVLVYQEQSMRLGRDLAGFDLKNVDRLRKAIGKKDQKEMAEVRKLFLAGAKETNVVPYEMAELVFSWIEKSGRYQFNKSHSLSYGILGYITAFLKYHFPLYFFTSWIHYARDKADNQEEIRELVSEAKLFDVAVVPPSILRPEPYTQTNHKEVIVGLADIKGVGETSVAKLIEASKEIAKQLQKNFADISWFEFLINSSSFTTPSIMDKLIRSGALRHFGLSRTKMQAEFSAWDNLTKLEQTWIREHPAADIIGALTLLAPTRKEGGGTATKKRKELVLTTIQLLKNPPYPLQDFPNWIVSQEEDLLGVALTVTKSEATIDPSQVTTTCKQFLAGQNGLNGYIVLGVELNIVREVKCRQGKSAGKKMCFLTVSDSSCSLSDVVVFADVYAQHENLLQEGNCVYLCGERDKKKGGLIVKIIWQA